MIEIPAEMKAQMKLNRLNQYMARIYEAQMDITAYEAVGDTIRLDMAQKNLEDLEKSYYAVEAM